MSFSAEKIRREFPFFLNKQNIYLDSAATCQTPQAVLDEVNNYYANIGGNVHRGINLQIENATNAYEKSRKIVADFINAETEEIIFTKNSTEAINLAAQAWAKHNLKHGDIVILSILEHHSNIVPWIMLKEELGIEIKWIECNKSGELLIDNGKELLKSGNVKLLSVTGQSNVFGTKPDIKHITKIAHAAGSKVFIDASQLIVHQKVDIEDIGCDFLAFSGHKLYGPTGIGVLFAKKEIQRNMKPWIGGGGMVSEVTKTGFTPADFPHCFEAGTPPIAQAIGLKAAIKWLEQFNRIDIEKHEEKLLEYARNVLIKNKKIHVLGINGKDKQSGCISFTVDGVHPHDLSDILSEKGISVRAGNHCAKPLHDHLKINASTRLSVAMYNTKEDIDAFGEGLKEALNILL